MLGSAVGSVPPPVRFGHMFGSVVYFARQRRLRQFVLSLDARSGAFFGYEMSFAFSADGFFLAVV